MAEGAQESKQVVTKNKKDCSLHKLMDAIHHNDSVKFVELLSDISTRKLNHLVRLKYEGYVGYTITPLLWAVIKGDHGIVKLLLSKSINVDKIGTYKEHETLHSISPLLVAVRNQDSEMVNLLLDKGACVQQGVPGQRTEEEEGSFWQYIKHVFPMNVSIGYNIDIFKMLLSHADVTLEYGTEEHTCLCYTLEYFIENENAFSISSLRYVKHVLNYGGVFCESEKVKHSFFPGQKLCWILRIFMWGLLSPECTCKQGMEKYSNRICCLRLLLHTDYSHKNSFIYKVCKHYIALVEAEGPKSEFCVAAVPAEMMRVLQSTLMPSSLLHISLVAVRRLVIPVTFEKLKKLNLPDKLIKYAMLDDI